MPKVIAAELLLLEIIELYMLGVTEVPLEVFPTSPIEVFNRTGNAPLPAVVRETILE